MIPRVLPLLLLLLVAPAHAEPFPALTDAAVLPRGHFSVGIVAPLRVGLDGFMELDAQVVAWLMLSPNLTMRLRLVDHPRLRMSGLVGLSTPTPAMRLLKGYLFPKWETSPSNVGWFVVPELGVVASTGRRLVLTARATMAVGIPASSNDARSLDTYAPIELIFAPALNRYHAALHVIADYGMWSWLRFRAETAVHLIGKGDPPRSPWIWNFQAATDLALGRRLRLSLGVTLYNLDQRRQQIVRGSDGRWERVAVRSTDVYPSLDLAWVQ